MKKMNCSKCEKDTKVEDVFFRVMEYLKIADTYINSKVDEDENLIRLGLLFDTMMNTIAELNQYYEIINKDT